MVALTVEGIVLVLVFLSFGVFRLNTSLPIARLRAGTLSNKNSIFTHFTKRIAMWECYVARLVTAARRPAEAGALCSANACYL